MKNLHELTELQLLIMNEIWRRDEATVLEVHGALEDRTRLARKTIGTLMLRLEQYGLLTHREEGREYVYSALVSQSEVRQATIRSMIGSLFEGDVAELVSHALDSREVAPGDVERVRRMLEEKGE